MVVNVDFAWMFVNSWMCSSNREWGRRWWATYIGVSKSCNVFAGLCHNVKPSWALLFRVRCSTRGYLSRCMLITTKTHHLRHSYKAPDEENSQITLTYPTSPTSWPTSSCSHSALKDGGILKGLQQCCSLRLVTSLSFLLLLSTRI